MEYLLCDHENHPNQYNQLYSKKEQSPLSFKENLWDIR